MRKAQGPFRAKDRLPILDELVLTLLSQNTSDTNRDRAFAALKSRFPTWTDVAAASTEEIADAIRPGGLAATKAARMKAILDEIERREGRVDLARLEALDDEEVRAYLSSLPGIGPKTVACVLVFAMGRAAFPIDTHVHRVARRLGWIDEKTDAARAHETLAPKVPAELRYDLHVALIEHGRTICVARVPRCSDCVVFDLCEAGSRLLAEGRAR